MGTAEEISTDLLIQQFGGEAVVFNFPGFFFSCKRLCSIAFNSH